MEALYSVMQGLESRLGGGEGVEGIYGSITATGMHKVLECLRINCDLKENSVLVDIGAGLGRPLLHALLLHNIAHAYGVELDSVKVAKADAFCKGVLDELNSRGIISNHHQQQQQDKQGVEQDADQKQQRQGDRSHSRLPSKTAVSDVGTSSKLHQIDSASNSCNDSAINSAAATTPVLSGSSSRTAASSKGKGSLKPPQSSPIITCASIEQIASLDAASHAYSFWEGVPLSGKQAFGRLFRQARSLRAVAVVQRAIRGQRPEVYMRSLGFGPLQLIAAFPVNMSGSGRSFQAYVFSKTQTPLELLRRHGNNTRKAAAAAAATQGEETRAATGSAAGSDVHFDGLVSCTKPQTRRPRYAATAAGDGSSSGHDGDGDDDSDLENQDPQAAAAACHKLVPLLTEELIKQQQQSSPQKRGPGAAAAASQDAAGDFGASPSKKAKGGNFSSRQLQLWQQDCLAAAPSAAAGSGYGLRRRLNLSSNSSGSMASSSSVRTAASGAAGGSSRSRRPTSAGKQHHHHHHQGGGGADMAVSVGTVVTNTSKKSTAASSGRGSRSTAVSGASKSKSAAGKPSTHVAASSSVVAAAVPGSKGRSGSKKAAGGGQQAHTSVSAAVSDARAAVSALGM